jgi:hypothetical protein
VVSRSGREFARGGKKTDDGKHADIFHSLIDELQLFGRKVQALTRANEQRLIATRLHLNESGAQLVSRSGPNRPLRMNGSFSR